MESSGRGQNLAGHSLPGEIIAGPLIAAGAFRELERRILQWFTGCGYRAQARMGCFMRLTAGKPMVNRSFARRLMTQTEPQVKMPQKTQEPNLDQ